MLILVTFGHLLAEPLYAFHTHVVPRAILLVVVLAMFDDDALSVDGWLSRRGGGLSTTAALTLFVLATNATPLAAQSGDPAAAPTIDERMLSALRLRGIGPALMSGRIADIAVDPTNRSIWYVATSSDSNVWKTENRGTTWTPIFDDYPAMGGLWAPGGDRGLFKTTDGGENWAPVLEISENTGIADVHFDPRDPDVLYAVAFQRRRHVGILVAGGPESGVCNVGTDDGLVQVSEDGGGAWRREEVFPGVPSMAYVADVVASRHEPDRVYAVFNNHKEGDFRPYVDRSDDRGASWMTNITGDVPDGQSSWTLVEDHVDPELLFLGTEFGLFATRGGGGSWVRLKGGLPTIAVRDLEIQRREDDLVLATFGRGFYILDDYSPLRRVDEAVGAGAAYLFPVKDPWAYIPARPLGGQEKGTLGDAFFTAPNPSFGAVVTYHLRDGYESLKERRHRLEREALARGDDITYPDRATLTAEDMERPPEVFVVVSDAAGDVVRRVPAPRGAGLHRIAWDLRYASLEPPTPGGGEADGPMVAPGEYSARVVLVTGDGFEDLTAPQSFTVNPLGTAPPSPPPTAPPCSPSSARSPPCSGPPSPRTARRGKPRSGWFCYAVRYAPPPDWTRRRTKPASPPSRSAFSRSGASCRGTAPRSTGRNSRRHRSCNGSRASWAHSSGRLPRPRPRSGRATR